MSILDQIKREAEEARERERKERESAAVRVASFRAETDAAMRATYQYLRDLVDSLKQLKTGVSSSYEVEGYGLLDGLVQSDYVLSAPGDLRHIEALSLSFVCSAPGTVGFSRETPAAVQQMRDQLWKHGLRFDYRDTTVQGGVKRFRGEFRLERRVPVTLTFTIDTEHMRIRLTTKNFEVLGEDMYLLKPDGLNQALLEELAKAIVRKPNRLREMTGYQIPDAVREQWQQKLQAEARAKERAAAAAAAEPPAPAKRKGLLGALFGPRGDR